MARNGSDSAAERGFSPGRGGAVTPRAEVTDDDTVVSPVARFMAAFVDAPRVAEVYNLGGGKANSCSILEAFSITESFTGTPQRFTYVDENRIGDHICYYSDLRKMRAHYPNWDITHSLSDTISQIVNAWKSRT